MKDSKEHKEREKKSNENDVHDGHLADARKVTEVSPVVHSDVVDVDVEEEHETPALSVSSPSKDVKSVSVKMNRTVLVSLIVAIVIIGLAYYGKGCFIAATVNGSPISRLEVIRELEKKSGKQALDNLIMRKLISDEAKKKGVVITDEEVKTEITSLEAEVSKQGMSLDQLLEMQGMTRDDLMTQMRLQKEVEKISGVDVSITAEEVAKYITDNKITLPKEGAEEAKTQIAEQLKAQKAAQAGEAYVTALRESAVVNKFVSY